MCKFVWPESFIFIVVSFLNLLLIHANSIFLRRLIYSQSRAIKEENWFPFHGKRKTLKFERSPWTEDEIETGTTSSKKFVRSSGNKHYDSDWHMFVGKSTGWFGLKRMTFESDIANKRFRSLWIFHQGNQNFVNTYRDSWSWNQKKHERNRYLKRENTSPLHEAVERIPWMKFSWLPVCRLVYLSLLIFTHLLCIPREKKLTHLTDE